MKKPRYMIYDPVTMRFLREATRPGDSAVDIVTTWTRHADKALKLPGVKSARALVEKLHGDDLIIINGKGDVLGWTGQWAD